LRGVADHDFRLPTCTAEPFSLDQPSCLSLLEDLPLSRWIEARLLPLCELDITEQRQAICHEWQALDRRELFLLNRLLTGLFRVGVSHTLVGRAIAQMAGLQAATVADRVMGEWTPRPPSSNN
jgi:DNA ligase-1